MTNEEVGQYITLMCIQHQKGHIKITQKITQPNNRVIHEVMYGYLASFEVLPKVLEKFTQDENGLYYNKRLEKEILSRSKFFDKQRENGKKGGNPNFKKGKKNPYYDDQEDNPKDNPKDNPNTVNENRDENENRDIGGMGEKEGEPEKKLQEADDELSFEKVWAMYGRKGNKKTSQRKWDRLPKKAKQLAVVHIPKYVAATPDIQYRKNFETYINQEAWNDKIFENGLRKASTNKRAGQFLPPDNEDEKNKLLAKIGG
ncbi:MAG: hypothetical protein LBS01_04490 [Prevotellaceae bacterium]|nr:hypothetical protein [Prevotellaceae bacterium]